MPSSATAITWTMPSTPLPFPASVAFADPPASASAAALRPAPCSAVPRATPPAFVEQWDQAHAADSAWQWEAADGPGPDNPFHHDWFKRGPSHAMI